jgi:hypothetical protein
MNQPAYNVPQMTLGEINERLKKHGLPTIAQNQVEAIQQHAARDQIINAVLDLEYTPQAKEFLESRFKLAGIFHRQSRPGTQTLYNATGGPRRPDNSQGPAPQSRPSEQGSRAPQNQARSQGSGQQGAARQNNSPAQPTNPNPQRPGHSPAQQSSHARTEQSGQPGEGSGASNVVPIEERMSTHVYARNNAALCFEADIAKSGFKTIAIDGAKASGSNFDWANKTRIQLTKGEIPAVLAVLIGASQFCEFKNHGPSNNKGFSVERQGAKLYIKMFEKGKPLIGVPVHPQDLFYVYSLFMKRVIDENPWLDSTAVIQMVKSTQPNTPAPAENPSGRNSGGGYQSGGYQNQGGG